MSSFFDSASLVQIPSGYSDGTLYSVKPIDGSGDLTFTRSIDSATRVASNGLIERVRTNQVQQSETLDNAYWNKTNVSVTANAIANPLDGALTAELLTVTDPSGPVEKTIINGTQSYTAGTPYTISAYFKAGTISTNFKILAYDGVTLYQSGIIDLATIGNSTAPYEDVGGGWYRFRFTFTPANSTATGIVYLVNYAFGVVANTGTNVYVYGAQIETGDIATNYIATTSAAVSVGPVANLPRLDYLGSSCPRLILEPQRVNLAQFSESFNNAYWTQNATVTANSTISPSGYQDADTLTDASNSYLDVRRSFTITASTAYTFSTFVKKTTGTLTNYAGIGFSGGGGVETGYAIFNTTTGVVNLADIAGGFVLSAKSTSYGDYYRFEMTFTTGQTSLLVLIYPALSQNGTTLSSDAQGSNVFWGAQLEEGAYATSYIPTLGAAVTRAFDSCIKTSASALFGTSEGSIFVEGEVILDANGSMPFTAGSSSAHLIYAWTRTNGQVNFDFYQGGTLQASITTSAGTLSNGDSFKMAVAYQDNDFVAYLNGTQVGTDTSGTAPNPDTFRLGGYITPDYYGSGVKQALVFPTRLSNSDLAALTA